MPSLRTVCPKKKAIANLAVHTPGKCDDGLMLPMSHDEDSRSLMAVRRTVSKKPERASSKSSVQHIDSDHNIDVMSSGEEAQTLRVVQRSESGEWQLTTPPPSSPEGAAEKRAMARKMKDVPLKETKMKLGKHRGSTYEMVVLNDPNVQGRDEHIEKTQG
jgi:hypothetical protein